MATLSFKKKLKPWKNFVSFADELRGQYADLNPPTLFVTDTVNFFHGQTTLQTRSLLLRIFKLACLCLDDRYRPLPVVKFSSVNTENPTSKLVHIVLPVQSYLNSVPDVVGTLKTESSFSQFLELETTFGGSTLSGTYNPWVDLNTFGRVGIAGKQDNKGVCKSGPSREKTTSTFGLTPPTTIRVPM